jgi:hypothetical protein
VEGKDAAGNAVKFLQVGGRTTAYVPALQPKPKRLVGDVGAAGTMGASSDAAQSVPVAAVGHTLDKKRGRARGICSHDRVIKKANQVDSVPNQFPAEDFKGRRMPKKAPHSQALANLAPSQTMMNPDGTGGKPRLQNKRIRRLADNAQAMHREAGSSHVIGHTIEKPVAPGTRKRAVHTQAANNGGELGSLELRVTERQERLDAAVDVVDGRLLRSGRVLQHARLAKQ